MQDGRYDHEHFRATAERAAKVVTRLVYDWLAPRSVLDVGCALGVWLAEWEALGADVTGTDLPYLDRSKLLIDPAKFVPADFTEPLDLGRQFDLVTSLEVAEHLDERYADQFVESLARHGNVILFSAAIPHQGGIEHRNCQWPSWWAGKFEAHGFTTLDVVRPAIWEDKTVAWWYRQNTVLYARGEALNRLPPPSGMPLDVVHPRWYLDLLAPRSLRAHTDDYAQHVKDAVRRKLR
jgi:SAM-dependent methyltransferase